MRLGGMFSPLWRLASEPALLDFVASPTTVALAASPWPDFTRISASGRTGDLSAVPYILAEWNWAFTTYYGWLIGDQLLLWTNAVCGVITMYYILVFAKHCPPAGKVRKSCQLRTEWGVIGAFARAHGGMLHVS